MGSNENGFINSSAFLDRLRTIIQRDQNVKLKILPKQFRLTLLICVALAEITITFQPNSASIRRVKSAVRSIGQCDSIVLVSVDKHEINLGIATKPKDGSIIKKIEPKPVYHDVPVLEFATIKDRQNLLEIRSRILNGLDRKPRAVTGCTSWVGSLFICRKNHMTKISFDDLTGIIWLNDGGYGYEARGSATLWNEIMTKALGQPSIAEGPCHEAAKLSWNSNP